MSLCIDEPASLQPENHAILALFYSECAHRYKADCSLGIGWGQGFGPAAGLPPGVRARKVPDEKYRFAFLGGPARSQFGTVRKSVWSRRFRLRLF